MKNIKKYSILLTMLVASLSSCNVEEKLDTKSDIRLTQATTIADFQSLLDGINGAFGILPSQNYMGEYMSDNVYLTDTNYDGFGTNILAKKAYTWDKQLFDDVTSLTEWNNSYKTILITNLTLEGLERIPVTNANRNEWNLAKGSALMMRAFTFLNLTEYWSSPYKASSAGTDLGIVLKLNSDITEKLTRSNVQETYNQILSDFKTAAELLPNSSAANTSASKARPSKAAAYGLLARTYLAMQDYQNVKLYSDNALNLYATLMDYNTDFALKNTRFYNKEIVFHALDTDKGYSINRYYIEPSLVNSYATNDLRGKYFFKKTTNATGTFYQFDGDYANGSNFTGLANDEVYLMRAEANARLGNATSAMNDLNALLVKRFTTGTYVNRTATTADDALNQVLIERRKELVIRGRRWADLKRLNADSRFAKELTRTVKGATYTLPANDSRYTLQIPPYLGSNY